MMKHKLVKVLTLCIVVLMLLPATVLAANAAIEANVRGCAKISILRYLGPDGKGRVLTDIDEEYDEETQTWKLDEKNVHTYDDANKAETIVRYDSDGKGGEVIGSRTIINYDDAGREHIREANTYNTATGTISFAYRYTYTYDEKGNVLTELSENFQGDEFVNSGRKFYTYDDKNREIEQRQQMFYKAEGAEAADRHDERQ